MENMTIRLFLKLFLIEKEVESVNYRCNLLQFEKWIMVKKEKNKGELVITSFFSFSRFEIKILEASTVLLKDILNHRCNWKRQCRHNKQHQTPTENLLILFPPPRETKFNNSTYYQKEKKEWRVSLFSMFET